MDGKHKIARSMRHGEGHIVHQTNITDLPETIIHLITSSLSIKDVARMSVSCRPWRYLCYTTPYLKLDVDDLCNGNKVLVKKVVNFVGRLLVLRHPLRLECFTLTCSRTRVSEYHVETWILYALKCNVQELDLDISPKSFELPIDIFTLPSLRMLTLDMNHQYLKLPPCVGLTNLKSLWLVFAHLPDDPLAGWISTQCLSLKELGIDCCYGFNTLNIISSSIKRLTILDPEKGQLQHLNISCQNLKVLHVVLLSPYHAQNSFKLFTPYLRRSILKFRRIIDCCHWNPIELLQDVMLDICSCDDWKAVFAFGSQLLTFFTKAKELHLCSVSMQVLAWMMKEDPSLSCYTENLKFRTHLRSDDRMLIKYLLGRAPNLKRLFISQEKYHEEGLLHEDVSNEIWRVPDVVVSAHRLKIVRISLLGSGTRSLKLAKYLLSNAKELEELIIAYLASDVERAKKMEQKLKKSAKVSSSYAKICIFPTEELDIIY